MHCLLYTSGNVYQGCRVTLSGKESKVEKSIGYFLDGNDKLDMNYVVDHIAPRTECDIDAQGVLEGTSEKVFRGTIDFKNGCAGAVGGEIESVLMRSDDVVCQSIPVILCSEEDVAGNHGASIGKLDEDLLFYMSSRGLKEEDIYDTVSYTHLISAKKMRELKNGDVYPCMGCRSFLTADTVGMGENGEHKYYCLLYTS